MVKKILGGITVISIIAVILLSLPQSTDIDATINEFETIVFENPESIQEYMGTNEYKNTCRELYQKWLELRKQGAIYGAPHEFIDQIKKLYCFDSIETWN